MLGHDLPRVAISGKLVLRHLHVPLDMRTSLDHLILGASDLMRGIEFVEQFTGVRAAFGGVHPGRGTQNALLSLGPHCYLEILAPDPEQNALAWFRTLPQLPVPSLVGWMVHPSHHPGQSNADLLAGRGDLAAVAERLRKAGIAYDGPRENCRLRPDGRTLRWKLLRLADDRQGLLPILIEWSPDSPHPAADAPSGCRLARFEISSPERDELQRVFEVLGLDLPIASDRPQLRARVVGSKGILELTS